MIRNKRGIMFVSAWDFVLLIFLLMVFFTFIFLINWFANISTDTNQAEALTVINRLYYSPNSFNYHDGTRPYPGIIDPVKFTDTTVLNVMDPGKNKTYAVKMYLRDDKDSPYLSPIFVNALWFDRWEKLTAFKGKGAVDRHIEAKPVLIRKGETFKQGTLYFEVLLPN